MQGIRRSVTATALTFAAIAAAAVPVHAAAGPGNGLGPSTFHMEDLVSGAADDPAVMMADEQNALVVFGTYAATPYGQIRVCKVGPVPAAACAAPGPILNPQFSGIGNLAIHPGNTPGLVYLTNGTANETELFTSTDGGATWGPGVRISTYANAADFLVLPDGNLALVGTGDQNPVLATHFVIVPPDGSGLTTPGFSIPGDLAQRGIAYNGGKFVIFGGGFLGPGTDTGVNYAVFSGAGNPNDIANWSTSPLGWNFGDDPNIAEGKAGVLAIGTVDGKVLISTLSGTTFSAGTQIADKAGTAYLPNLTSDPSGRYTATWQVNNVGLRMSQSPDGVHWTAPMTINPDREYQTATARTAAGNGLAVTRGGSAYIATRLYGAVDLTLKSSPTKVKKGKQSTLTATLHNEGGTGISGQKITFKVGSKSVGSATTNGSGQATLTVKPSKSTSYTAAFTGNASLEAYTSGKATVKVTKK